jgi:hypothetical protein
MTLNEGVDRQRVRARRWLRLDALYCAAAGAIVLALCVPLGRLFHIAPPLAAVLGAGTLGWAVLLARLAARHDWRRSTRFVAGANVAAAVGLLVLALAAPTMTARVLLLAVAAEVATFAVAQTHTLRR